MDLETSVPPTLRPDGRMLAAPVPGMDYRIGAVDLYSLPSGRHVRRVAVDCGADICAGINWLGSRRLEVTSVNPGGRVRGHIYNLRGKKVVMVGNKTCFHTYGSVRRHQRGNLWLFYGSIQDRGFAKAVVLQNVITGKVARVMRLKWLPAKTQEPWADTRAFVPTGRWHAHVVYPNGRVIGFDLRKQRMLADARLPACVPTK